jgi:putative acetyltransferase
MARLIEKSNHHTEIIIRPESPLHPKLTPIFIAKEAHSAALYPAESNFAFNPAQLDKPNILFLVAEQRNGEGEGEGDFVGCGACVNYGDYGEIKSMWVNAEVRGQRIAERMLQMLEDHLRSQGLTVARLETGVVSHSALRLYARMGYQRRGPFADYPDDPLCVFMEKVL